MEQSNEDRENKYKLYKLLLEKYSEILNNQEQKTVGEIKGSINAEDLTVQNIVNRFKPENYSYEKDFLETLKAIYEFIIKEINFVKSDLAINFWLSPNEIIKWKVCDDEDIAVLLCSILKCLGNENCQVIICELEDYSTHSFVITEYDEKFLLLDAYQKKPFEMFIGKKEEVLYNYQVKNQKIKRFLYKFNDKEYEQFI